MAIRPRSQQEIDGPTLHVGRSPTCYDFLPLGSRSRPPFGGQGRQGIDAPICFNGGGEAKVGAADFGQRPLSSTRDAQPMNSQPGELSVLPGRVKTGGVTPVVYDVLFCGCIHL
jgi:hypothetical protein